MTNFIKKLQFRLFWRFQALECVHFCASGDHYVIALGCAVKHFFGNSNGSSVPNLCAGSSFVSSTS